MNDMEDMKAYVDGELSPERRSEIEAAMEQDARLRQEMEEIRVLSRLIGDCVVEIEPVGLDETVARLERGRGRPRHVWLRLFKDPVRYGWAWALGLFVLLAIFLPMFQRAERPSEGKLAFYHADTVSPSVQDDHTASSTPAPMAGAGEPDTSGKIRNEGNAAPGAAAAEGGRVRYRTPGRIGFGSAPVGSVQWVGGGPGTGTGTGTRTGTGSSVGGAARLGSEGEGYAPNSEAGVDVLSSPYPKGGSAMDGTLKGDMPFTMGMVPPKETRNGMPSVGAGSRSARLSQEVGAKMKSAAQVPTFAPPLLIRTAELDIQVSDVGSAVTQAKETTNSLGGYVQDSSTSMDEDNMPQAQMTIRVPVDRFEEAEKRLRKFGKILSESTSANDVTAQVADTEGKVSELRAEETSYLGMLRGAKHIDDNLAVRDRLDSVRQDLASLESQVKTLRNQATYSTISLSLTQNVAKPTPPPAPGWFDTAWSGAKERASGLGRWFAEVGMNLLLLAPVWVPIVALFWWLGRRARRA